MDSVGGIELGNRFAVVSEVGVFVNQQLHVFQWLVLLYSIHKYVDTVPHLYHNVVGSGVTSEKR